MLFAILCPQSAPHFLAHEIFILYAYRSPSIKVTFGVGIDKKPPPHPVVVTSR
ncbi:hypothetical protein AERO9A_400095 [Aeromonas salmonicida]|nr:hypothetical protein AERO9A_400095 [Aeromonas salmonicida]